MKNPESGPAAAAPRLAFGEFLLDVQQRRLLHRSGEPLTLTPRQFDALLLFAERAGELLDKESLLAALWPGLVVEENNLNQLISALRRALKDDPQDSRYIQTVPRRGFRFVAPVSRPEPASGAGDSAASPPPARAPDPASAHLTRRRSLLAGAIVATAAGIGTALTYLRPAQAPRAGAATLAVLPFKPLVIEGRNELLEVGMADSLIARLSRVPGLVVRSVGAVRRYAGPDQDAQQAARDLNVGWVVDGSLQQWGEQIRVTARLLHAADGTAAWSGSFDERFTNMFDVQDAISERVAGVLMPQLRKQSPAQLAAGATRNFDAYQLYLGARQHAQSIRADGLQRSVALYQQAIELDSRYALAYAGLAETYRRMVFGADGQPSDVLERARAAAQRALELEPQLAEAHAALGWVRFWYEWDWQHAEEAFREAIRMNPNVVEAHFGLGLLLLSLDRPDEGLKQLRAARELEPLSLILNTLEAGFQLNRGEPAEGRARLNRVLEIAPDFWVAHLTQAGFHLADNEAELAIEALRRADRLADRSTQAAGLLGHVLARQGRRDEARAVLDRLLKLANERYVPPTSIAMVYAGLEETRSALDALERAYAMRDPRLAYMKDDGRWTSLHADAHYRALLKRMKLDVHGRGLPAN